MQTPPLAIGSNAPKLHILPDRQGLGSAAAEHVVRLLRSIIATQGAARVIFACAPSQDQFLDALLEHSKGQVDWGKVTGFHMDEYIGLSEQHPASFRSYLRGRFLSHVQLKEFHAILGEAENPAEECSRYAKLIAAEPIDLICLGIGENGHLAFNDPPVADFDDQETAKIVELDLACRMQQVHDGCFATLDAVPRLRRQARRGHGPAHHW
ncbi:MAG: glucosamine-6-phosphate isomerase [Verrucomicrobia bacterium]|nr:glucosamine-6-phosphate isomerase [Verrucomicrobiota bacterium]